MTPTNLIVLFSWWAAGRHDGSGDESDGTGKRAERGDAAAIIAKDPE